MEIPEKSDELFASVLSSEVIGTIWTSAGIYVSVGGTKSCFWASGVTGD